MLISTAGTLDLMIRSASLLATLFSLFDYALEVERIDGTLERKPRAS